MHAFIMAIIDHVVLATAFNAQGLLRDAMEYRIP